MRVLWLDAKFSGVRAMDTGPDVYFAALGGDAEAWRSVCTQFLDRARELDDFLSPLSATSATGR
jgi:hypothetical protein